MRLFTLVVSAVFVEIGVLVIADGRPPGWLVAGFFGLCLLVAVFEPWLSKPKVECEYRLVITPDDVACEPPKRARGGVRWEAFERVWVVTTSDGPWRPDQWLLLEGGHGGCSVPNEAIDFDSIWDELKRRFAGFDYGPLISGGTDDARHLCWDRQSSTASNRRGESR